MTTSIGPLDKDELKYAIFNFSNELATGGTITTAVVTVELVVGIDASPSGLLSGGVTIDSANKLVSQRVAGAGRAGNTYRLRCQATDNSANVHTVAALLAVVSL